MSHSSQEAPSVLNDADNSSPKGVADRRRGLTLRLFFFFGTPISVLLTRAVLYCAWNFDRPPVNMSKLKSLRPGVTRDQVTAAIGKPKDVYYEGRQWAYSRVGGWSIVS